MDGPEGVEVDWSSFDLVNLRVLLLPFLPVVSSFSPEAVGHQPELRKGAEARVRVLVAMSVAERPLETAAVKLSIVLGIGNYG